MIDQLAATRKALISLVGSLLVVWLGAEAGTAEAIASALVTAITTWAVPNKPPTNT